MPVLFQERSDSVRVAWDKLRSAYPEVLVIACCEHTVERTRRDLPILGSLPGWDGLRAMQDRRAYVADGSAYFSRPGPRLVDTLEILAAIFHQDLDAHYPDRCHSPGGARTTSK